MSFNARNSKSNQLLWMLISIGIAIPIGLFIPFPISMLVVFIAILAMAYLRIIYTMKKAGMNSFRQMFRTLSNPQNHYQLLRYFCMSCGHEHREISCPNCDLVTSWGSSANPYLSWSHGWRQLSKDYLVTKWLSDLLIRIFMIDKTPTVAIMLAKDIDISQPISSDI